MAAASAASISAGVVASSIALGGAEPDAVDHRADLAEQRGTGDVELRHLPAGVGGDAELGGDERVAADRIGVMSPGSSSGIG